MSAAGRAVLGGALAAAAVVLLTAGRPPVVDEEVWLFLGRAFRADPLHPYGWWRPMQPWTPGPPSLHFAHPPLFSAWVGLLLGTGASLPVLRILVALPFALLLGAAAGLLAVRTTPRPALATLAWVASPVAVLSLGAGLMVDLAAVALGTAAVAAWREGLEPGGRRRRWWLGAGLLLGLAGATKYPLLVLLPVIALHAAATGTLRRSGPLWVGFLLAWGSVQAWVLGAHGVFHPAEVLSTAGDIARGPLGGRVLGVLARAGLLVVPLPALFLGPGALVAAAALAGLALGWGRPEELSPLQWSVLALLAATGAAWAVAGVRGLRRGDPDGLLLGAWLLAVLLAVSLGHNYASGRYLLPAVVPAACLAARAAGGRRGVALAAGVAGFGLLAAAMSWADHRYAVALRSVAERVDAAWPAVAGQERFFTGEWAFRQVLESAGWTPVAGAGGTLAPGDLVATPSYAGAGPLPWARLEPVDRIRSTDTFPLRLTDHEAQAGWYGETLGAVPLWVRDAPLEEVRVYRVR